MNRESIMQRWDVWREYIANGGGGSWPRDEFEIILDYYDDDEVVGLPAEKDAPNTYSNVYTEGLDCQKVYIDQVSSTYKNRVFAACSINDCTGEVYYPPPISTPVFYGNVTSPYNGKTILSCSNAPNHNGKQTRGNACCSPQPDRCKQLNGDFNKEIR